MSKTDRTGLKAKEDQLKTKILSLMPILCNKMDKLKQVKTSTSLTVCMFTTPFLTVITYQNRSLFCHSVTPQIIEWIYATQENKSTHFLESVKQAIRLERAERCKQWQVYKESMKVRKATFTK